MSTDSTISTLTITKVTTLVSNYVIDITTDNDEETWALYSMFEHPTRHLYSKRNTTPKYCLHGVITSTKDKNIEITMKTTLDPTEKDLMDVLCKLITQRLWTRYPAITTVHTILEDTKEIASYKNNYSNVMDNHRMHSLFPTCEEDELVELVDGSGSPIAVLPRLLIHKYNMLHRGIGVIVLAPQEEQSPLQEEEETVTNNYHKYSVYCHQRTFSKRIFPGLYDMFVGGVSGVGECSKQTATRELAEELGIIINNDSRMSNALVSCCICTSYNRCVVTVFQYMYDPTLDSPIKWQKEEVAWGEFVPYPTVEILAELSIQRLVEESKWPGEEPFHYRNISDNRHGMLPRWDFVPDGLLVWQAWQNWVYSNP